MPNRTILTLAVTLALVAPLARARVVINEIMYHAPDDLEDLQYIELYNSSAVAVDLNGWSFSKGIQFTFQKGEQIGPRGYAVICRNRARFKEFYNAPLAGEFSGTLKSKGERIELTDASGKIVDAIKFKDSAPWPTGADGYSGSLERISPEAGSDEPANWASSPLSENRDKPGGTPGKANGSFSAELPPVIERVSYAPVIVAPDQPITVTAELRSTPAVKSVTLLFRKAGPGFETAESRVAMEKASGNSYAAKIPGQNANQLVRFRVEAVGEGGAKRFYPAETEPRPALSAYVQGSIESALVPFGWIIPTTEAESKAARGRMNAPTFGDFGGGRPDPIEEARWHARVMLERGLDLSFPWYELTVNSAETDHALAKLKQCFQAKTGDRDKFIDDFLAAGQTEEQLRVSVETLAEFRSGLLGCARPLLSAKAYSALENSLENGDGFSGFPQIIRRRLDLEGAWYAVSMNADIEPAKLSAMRSSFQRLESERANLLAEMGDRPNPNVMRTLRDKVEGLRNKIVATLQEQATAEQRARLDEWRNFPHEVTVGLRAGGPPGGRMERGPGPMGPRGPGPFRQQSAEEAGSHRSAFVYYDPAIGKTELFDFVQVAARKGGQKIRFNKDHPLHGMTSINLVFEGETAAIVEALAYETYRRAGMPAELCYHIRLWVNDEPAGYQLLFEQPNGAFLRRHKIRDDGNMYKLLWFENGVAGQHEKKSNPRSGHQDIITLIEELNKTSGGAQWEVIQKNFDVDEVATYFAVNMILSHWDGFFNNYFTYHDVKGTGKWTMFPWDQDSTWGLRGAAPGRVYYNMALTFGMNGDQQPENGGMWRPPGWFSGPLLANPAFRKVFLAKTKELLETVYTDEVFEPIFTRMQQQLEPEAKFRARIKKQDPERAAAALKEVFVGAREHLRKRREFLLAQKELKNAGR